MLNQTILVGRIVNDPELIETENGKQYTNLTLAIPRPFKNENGEYDTDFIKCILWGATAANTVKYCNKGNVVGVKGRLQSNNYKDKEGHNIFSIDIIAEKITCLTSKSHNEPESER